MQRLVVLFYLALLRLKAGFEFKPKPGGRDQPNARSERGSVTNEHVLWAVAVVGIVAIVVAAIKAYVTSQSGNLK